jgi:hypothetical protein
MDKKIRKYQVYRQVEGILEPARVVDAANPVDALRIAKQKGELAPVIGEYYAHS